MKNKIPPFIHMHVHELTVSNVDAVLGEGWQDKAEVGSAIFEAARELANKGRFLILDLAAGIVAFEHPPSLN